MKKLLTICFCLLVLFSVRAQDAHPPFSNTFKLIVSPGFYYDSEDSSAWLYKGSVLGWTKLADSARLHKDYVPYKDAIRNVDLNNKSIISTQQNLPLNIGVRVFPTHTKNIDGTVSLGTDGVFTFSKDSVGLAGLITLPIVNDTILTLVDGVPNFVFASYNNGNPKYEVTTGNMGFIQDFRQVPIFRATREGTTIHFEEYDMYGLLLANKTMAKDIYLNGAQRHLGLTISTAATRISTVSAGSAYFGVQYYENIDANIAGSAGVMYEYYLVAGVWNKIQRTSYDASYCSDGTNRQNLGAQKYVAKYFFRDVGDDNEVYFIHGNEYVKETDAINEKMPSAPAVMTYHSIYVGKIVIQQGATNGTAYPRDWGEAIQNTGTSNHADLTNLAWASSLHTGNANTFATFDATGKASEALLSAYQTAITQGTTNQFYSWDKTWRQPSSSNLSDASNLAKLNAANVFTQNQTISKSNFTDAILYINQGSSTVGNMSKISFGGQTSDYANITAYGTAYGSGLNSEVKIANGFGSIRLRTNGSTTFSSSVQATTATFTTVGTTTGTTLLGRDTNGLLTTNLPANIFPTLNQNTTGTAAGLTNQYIDWNASSGGNSIANKPTLNVTNWNDAYGWGNHASQGYINSILKNGSGGVNANGYINFIEGSGISINHNGSDVTVNNTSPMVYPSAGLVKSTGSGWATSITDNSTNWNEAYAKIGSVYVGGDLCEFGLSSGDFYKDGNNQARIDFADYIAAFQPQAVNGTLVYNALQEKQDLLESGTNIKTINGSSILGSGNLSVTASIANAVTFNNSGSGAASGTTFDGSAARTISYNTIGAAKLDGSLSQAFNASQLTLEGGSYDWVIGQSSGYLKFQQYSTEVTFGSSGVTAANFILSSDRRLKTDIKPLNYKGIENIKFKQFRFKNDFNTRFGVIAQEVEKQFPDLVYEDEKGIKSVAYIDLLVAKIAALEDRVKELEKQNKHRRNEK